MSADAYATTKRLEGKVAIITGGANGIGACTANLFWEHGARAVNGFTHGDYYCYSLYGRNFHPWVNPLTPLHGATVVIADINDTLGQAIVDKLVHNISYVHCDISNEDHVRSLVDTTVEKYGKLDIMYNNAGILDCPFASILKTKKASLEHLINVNVVGSFLGAKHAARVMVPQKKGCILFTGSACTSVAGISSHTYAATKYAVLGLAKNLAGELGQYNIRVNVVSPFAVIGTGISGTGAMTEEQEKGAEEIVERFGHLKGAEVLRPIGVASAALYLTSDDASYVSGLNLVVDGGYSVINPTMLQSLGMY